MKIFASLGTHAFTLTKGNTPKRAMVYGAWVGGESLSLALLKHGAFDEYHFFVDSKTEAVSLRKVLSRFKLYSDKIKIIDTKDIPRRLQRTKYTVFFTCGPDLSGLAYLRLRYAHQYFPICGIAFQTISYASMLRGDFLNNLISDLHPFDAIICSSNAAYRVIKNLSHLVGSVFKGNQRNDIRYKGTLPILPFGIEAADYGKMDKLEARKQLGLPKEKIIVLYFGRFSVYDKADLYPLLVAFKEILKQRKEVMLLLAGVDAQGGYGAKLRKVAEQMGLSSNIRFILRNCLKEKYALYSASDIFVSPSDSIQESFGITVLEAMASGLPVVVSDWNGYKDLVEHKVTGLRVPTYWMDCYPADIKSSYARWELDHFYLAQSVCVDVCKLEEQLSILIRNRELRLRLGQNGRKKVLARYDWKVVIPAYEDLWQRLSARSENQKILKHRKELFMPQYFNSFRHYPTKILDAKTKISISKDGLSFLTTRKLPFKMPEEFQDIISLNLIFLILTFLLKKNSATIAEIAKHIREIFKAKPPIINYHIMWLLKKGLLRL